MTGQVVTWHDSEDQELRGTPWSSPGKPFLCNESHMQIWGEGSVSKCLQWREGAWGQSSHFHIKPRMGNERFYPSAGEVETGEALALARSLRDSALIMRWKVSLDKYSPYQVRDLSSVPEIHTVEEEQTHACCPLTCTHTLGQLWTHTHKEIKMTLRSGEQRAQTPDVEFWFPSALACTPTHGDPRTKPMGSVEVHTTSAFN